jgi:glycosyltransferase involved in cell wall biosynthesis
MKKLKVVWICHFSNESVRDKLPLTKKGKNVGDYASWVTNLIEEFEKFDNIELHIISPHQGLKIPLYFYESNGIHYHFFCPEYPYNNRYITYIIRHANRLLWFPYNHYIVKSIVKKINPDIINLIGAENDYYSSTVLRIKKYPILISIQGIYSNPYRFQLQLVKKDKIRYKIERKIHSENKYFTINASFMQGLIERDSKDSVIFWNRYPIRIEKIDGIKSIKKEYDFVFFSRLVTGKGPEDTLKAIAIVKKSIPNVSLRMMGYVSKSYLNTLINLTKELDIEENIHISDGYKIHKNLLQEAAKAKYYILPTKLDTIPSTIFEAIHLGLPVVSYRTGDIPLLNKGDERVLLCDREDITGLACNMLRLLEEPGLGEKLSQKAKNFVDEWFDNERLALNFVDQYHAVLAHYHHNKEIAPELLYENYLSNL